MLLDSSELVARHVALWNEPDAARRRRGVAAIYAPDAVLACDPLAPVCGHAAIAERMTDVRALAGPAAAGGAPSYTAGRRDLIRLRWTAAPAGHGVLVLDGDGRIKVEYRGAGGSAGQALLAGRGRAVRVDE